MIRKAKPQDEKKCIELIKMALGDIIYKLSGSNDELTTNAKLVELFNNEQNRISHKNMVVHELNGEISGMMISYKGSKTAWLDENYGEIFEPECNEDEYYIDAVAVDEKFQGLGIGSELLKHAEILAKEQNEIKISLLVETLKKKNIQLYEKLGFVIDESRNAYGIEFNHMIKEIK